ncbi:hypothetical protein SME36J_46180 [Serratia marcescens]|nr:hypothetical protein SME36J_46180 [Serratia marcescens]
MTEALANTIIPLYGKHAARLGAATPHHDI